MLTKSCRLGHHICRSPEDDMEIQEMGRVLAALCRHMIPDSGHGALAWVEGFAIVHHEGRWFQLDFMK